MCMVNNKWRKLGFSAFDSTSASRCGFAERLLFLLFTTKISAKYDCISYIQGTYDRLDEMLACKLHSIRLKMEL